MDPSTTLSLTVTFAVIAAAVTHAVWNAIAHGIKDQTLAFALIGVGGIAIGIPLVIVAAMPRSGCWPYLLGSVVIHIFYNLLLTARKAGTTQVIKSRSPPVPQTARGSRESRTRRLANC